MALRGDVLATRKPYGATQLKAVVTPPSAFHDNRGVDVEPCGGRGSSGGGGGGGGGVGGGGGGTKVSQIAHIFQAGTMGTAREDEARGVEAGTPGEGPGQDRDGPSHATVVRTESHLARFNNARAMFEKMGQGASTDVARPEGKVVKPTMASAKRTPFEKQDKVAAVAAAAAAAARRSSPSRPGSVSPRSASTLTASSLSRGSSRSPSPGVMARTRSESSQSSRDSSPPASISGGGSVPHRHTNGATNGHSPHIPNLPSLTNHLEEAEKEEVKAKRLDSSTISTASGRSMSISSTESSGSVETPLRPRVTPGTPRPIADRLSSTSSTTSSSCKSDKPEKPTKPEPFAKPEKLSKPEKFAKPEKLTERKPVVHHLQHQEMLQRHKNWFHSFSKSRSSPTTASPIKSETRPTSPIKSEPRSPRSLFKDGNESDIQEKESVISKELIKVALDKVEESSGAEKKDPCKDEVETKEKDKDKDKEQNELEAWSNVLQSRYGTKSKDGILNRKRSETSDTSIALTTSTTTTTTTSSSMSSTFCTSTTTTTTTTSNISGKSSSIPTLQDDWRRERAAILQGRSGPRSSVSDDEVVGPHSKALADTEIHSTTSTTSSTSSSTCTIPVPRYEEATTLQSRWAPPHNYSRGAKDTREDQTLSSVLTVSSSSSSSSTTSSSSSNIPVPSSSSSRESRQKAETPEVVSESSSHEVRENGITLEHKERADVILSETSAPESLRQQLLAEEPSRESRISRREWETTEQQHHTSVSSLVLKRRDATKDASEERVAPLQEVTESERRESERRESERRESERRESERRESERRESERRESERRESERRESERRESERRESERRESERRESERRESERRESERRELEKRESERREAEIRALERERGTPHVTERLEIDIDSRKRIRDRDKSKERKERAQIEASRQEEPVPEEVVVDRDRPTSFPSSARESEVDHLKEGQETVTSTGLVQSVASTSVVPSVSSTSSVSSVSSSRTVSSAAAASVSDTSYVPDDPAVRLYRRVDQGEESRTSVVEAKCSSGEEPGQGEGETTDYDNNNKVTVSREEVVESFVVEGRRHFDNVLQAEKVYVSSTEDISIEQDSEEKEEAAPVEGVKAIPEKEVDDGGDGGVGKRREDPSPVRRQLFPDLVPESETHRVVPPPDFDTAKPTVPVAASSSSSKPAGEQQEVEVPTVSPRRESLAALDALIHGRPFDRTTAAPTAAPTPPQGGQPPTTDPPPPVPRRGSDLMSPPVSPRKSSLEPPPVPVHAMSPSLTSSSSTSSSEPYSSPRPSEIPVVSPRRLSQGRSVAPPAGVDQLLQTSVDTTNINNGAAPPEVSKKSSSLEEDEEIMYDHTVTSAQDKYLFCSEPVTVEGIVNTESSQDDDTGEDPDPLPPPVPSHKVDPASLHPPGGASSSPSAPSAPSTTSSRSGTYSHSGSTGRSGSTSSPNQNRSTYGYSRSGSTDPPPSDPEFMTADEAKKLLSSKENSSVLSDEEAHEVALLLSPPRDQDFAPPVPPHYVPLEDEYDSRVASHFDPTLASPLSPEEEPSEADSSESSGDIAHVARVKEVLVEDGVHYLEDGHFWVEVPGLPDEDEADEDEHNIPFHQHTKLRFSVQPMQVFSTYSITEYDRKNEDVDPVAASAEYELEKRVEKMDVFPVEIEKGEGGLGLSIIGMGVGADAGVEKLGIFVKTITPMGATEKDGRIQVNDQIIEVDGKSLVGVTQVFAASVLKNTSGRVHFLIGREKDPENSEVAQLIRQSLQADREREERRRALGGPEYDPRSSHGLFDPPSSPSDDNSRSEDHLHGNLASYVDGGSSPASPDTTSPTPEVFDLEGDTSDTSPENDANALRLKLKEVQYRNAVAEAEIAKLKSRVLELEFALAEHEKVKDELFEANESLKDLEGKLRSTCTEAETYQDMLKQSQGQYIILEKKYYKAKKIIKEYQTRESDFLHREEYHITQQEEKDTHYNAIMKALKDRVIQLESELALTQKKAGLPVQVPSDGINALAHATSPQSSVKKLPVKEELDRAVPPHELLDVSASRAKGELATRGGLANRQLPSLKKTSSMNSAGSVDRSLDESGEDETVEPQVNVSQEGKPQESLPDSQNTEGHNLVQMTGMPLKQQTPFVPVSSGVTNQQQQQLQQQKLHQQQQQQQLQQQPLQQQQQSVVLNSSPYQAPTTCTHDMLQGKPNQLAFSPPHMPYDQTSSPTRLSDSRPEIPYRHPPPVARVQPVNRAEITESTSLASHMAQRTPQQHSLAEQLKALLAESFAHEEGLGLSRDGKSDESRHERDASPNKRSPTSLMEDVRQAVMQADVSLGKKPIISGPVNVASTAQVVSTGQMVQQMQSSPHHTPHSQPAFFPPARDGSKESLVGSRSPALMHGHLIGQHGNTPSGVILLSQKSIEATIPSHKTGFDNAPSEDHRLNSGPASLGSLDDGSGASLGSQSSLTHTPQPPLEKKQSHLWQSGPVYDWSKEQVSQWLLVHGLESHIPKFLEAGITGTRLINLDTRDLKNLGLQGEDKNKLKRKVKDLRITVEKERKQAEKEKKEKEKLQKKAEKLAEKAEKRKK